LRAALRWLPRALASLVLAMSGAKLFEIFGGFHFGIDVWFVRNPELFGAVPTGRMAPMTALNFVFIATGLPASNPQSSQAVSVRSLPLSARLFLLVTGTDAIAL
jgi:hypothetical protein